MAAISHRFGCRLLNEIKNHFGKDSHQFVTSEEFAEYSGINIEVVKDYLQKGSSQIILNKTKKHALFLVEFFLEQHLNVFI